MKLVGPNSWDMLNGEGIYSLGEDHGKLVQQTEYLNGVMHADPLTAPDLDAHTNGTAAFWRGFIEGGAGLVSKARYPRLDITAPYAMLARFVAWVQDHPGPENFEDLLGMCSRGKLRLTGDRAKLIVIWLYTDAWVSSPSKRARAEDVMRSR